MTDEPCPESPARPVAWHRTHTAISPPLTMFPITAFASERCAAVTPVTSQARHHTHGHRESQWPSEAVPSACGTSEQTEEGGEGEENSEVVSDSGWSESKR